jgi:Na+/serine symporter
MLRWCSRSIFLQVVIGLMLGIVCGLALPEFSSQLKPLGDGFIKLIKMLIGLIVFCVVVSGISGAGDLKKVGRIGLKSVIYFEVLTTVALVIGLIMAFSTGIGTGANIHLEQLSSAGLNELADKGQHIRGTSQFLMELIPNSVFGAFADNNVLQVLLFSVLFGSALNLVGEAASGISRLINELSHVIFRIMGMIVRLAPIGVFGAIAFTTSTYGLDSLQHLGSLVGLFYLTCFAFVGLVLGLVMRLSGLRMLPLLKYLREELLIVMGTASSDAVLRAVAVELPVDVLGLLNITVKTRVIEPAQISAIGNPQLIDTQPIFVRTAQVRTWISLKLPVIDVLNKVIGLVTDVVGLLLGSSLDPVPGTQIDIALEAASGSSYVTGYRCNGPADKSLAVTGSTSAVRLMVGQIDPKNLFSSTETLKVDDFALLDLGVKKCSRGVCEPRQPYAVGGLSLRVDSSVAKTTRDHVYVAPAEVKQPPSYYSFNSTNVIGSLSNTLNGIRLTNHTPTLDGLLGLVLGLVVGILTEVLNLLSGVISSVLSPLLDPLVNSLLAGLGIDLAKVEIGANLSCNPGGRAMLVI